MVASTKKTNIFFTKKKVISLVISVVVFTLFIYLTSKFFFDIDFVKIGNLFNDSYSKNSQSFFLWLFLLLIFPFYNVWLRIFFYKYKLSFHKNIYVNIHWYDWILFSLVTFFFSGVTPFAFGSEPYIIYWLNKKGISVKESTAMVASLNIVSPFVQVLITWPSFFVLCADYSTNATNLAWVGCFWSVFAGLIFDLMGTSFWLLMSLSKNAQLWWNIFLNWIKKIFKKSYKTKDELRYEYVAQESFKNMFIGQMKDWKFVVTTSIGSITWNVLYYCSMIFAFHLMAPDLPINEGQLFNYTNVATTANNFIPIPGAEGTLQAVLNTFIINSKDASITIPQKEFETITTNTVFIWRTTTFYLVTIIGLLAVILTVTRETIKKYKSRKINNYKI